MVSETKVVHCKREPFDVYIGRPSKWGNPFKIGIDGTRKQVITKYEEELLQSPLLLDILELKGKVLGCWCSPLPCHGDVLAKLANVTSLSLEGKPQLNLKVSTSEWRGMYGSCE